MAEGDIHTSKQGDHWVNKVEGNQRASNSASMRAGLSRVRLTPYL